MKYQIQSVGVLSVARICAALYGTIALLIVPFMLVMAVVAAFATASGNKLPGIVFVVFAILAPIFYAVMGFVIGAVAALVYNLVARKLGGIEADLVAVAASPASYVPGVI